MVLWTLHVYLGFGKKRLERFYRDMLKEHIHMREVYEMDDTYPERYKLNWAFFAIFLTSTPSKYHWLSMQIG